MRWILIFIPLFVLFQFGFNIELKSQIVQQDIIENDSVSKYTYQGFNYLYNFQFKSTDSIITIMLNKFPTSPWTYVLKSNYYWWMIISGDISEECKNNFYLSLNQSETVLKNKSGNENLFCSILIYSYKARFELINKNYISALKQLKKYYATLSVSFGLEKDYNAFYLTSGLYNYFMNKAVSEYPLLKPFLFMFEKGNKSTGLEYLKLLSNLDDNILKTESNYFLMKIYYEMESDKLTALSYSNSLKNEYPNNFIFNYYSHKIRNCKTTENEEFKKYKKRIISSNQLTKIQKYYFQYMLKFKY